MIFRITFLCVWIWVSTLYAGTYFVSKDYLRGIGGDIKFSRFYLEEDRFRIDFEIDFDKKSNIYIASENILYIIDHKSKTYLEVDEKSADIIKDQMRIEFVDQKIQVPTDNSDVGSTWDVKAVQKLKVLLPEDRQLFSYVPIAFGVSFKDWDGIQYDAFFKGAKVEELLLAPWTAVGIPTSNFQVLENLSSSFRSVIWRQTRGVYPGLQFSTQIKGVSGFPVRVVTYKNSKILRETELIKAKEQTFSPDTFQVPKAYSKFGVGSQ